MDAFILQDMNRRNFQLFSLCCTLVFNPVFVQAQTVLAPQRLSTAADGTGGDANSGPGVLSNNAEFAFFQSRASNLVSDDTNDEIDIFARSIDLGVTQRVSLGRFNIQPNARSTNPVVTQRLPGGFRIIAFESRASNIFRKLDFPDTNNRQDIYFNAPRANFTERISVGPGPVEADGASSSPSVTALPRPNRALVAYVSAATNLVAGDTNGFNDIFLGTLSNTESEDGFNFASNLSTIRITDVPLQGAQPNGDSDAPKISANGKFIVFQSDATNLIPGQTISGTQIYLYSAATQTISLISKASDGTPGNASSSTPSISFSGNFIVYLTDASNILSDGLSVPSGTLQVVRYNRKKGTSERVNVTAAGVPGNGTVFNNITAAVGVDGRFVTWSDAANNLVTSDLNNAVDVFIKDMALGTVVQASRGLADTDPDGASASPVLGGKRFNTAQRFIAYTSAASNLVSGDTEGNNDFFLSQLVIPPRPLKKDSTLEVPADVDLTENDVSVSLEDFAGVDVSKAQLPGSAAATSRPRARLQYQVIVRKDSESGRSREIKNKLTRRNELTFKNLKPGTYVVKYRTRIVKGERIISKTNYSPEQEVTIE